MSELDPQVRDLISLLVMLPDDWQHPVWQAVSQDNDHYNALSQISPLVREVAGRNHGASDALVLETLDMFSDLSAETLRLIGDQVIAGQTGPQLGEVWVGEVLEVALRAYASRVPESWRERAVAWGAAS